MNPELLAVLLRFRWHRVAWVGNIEKTFLQIEIHAEDRDALRFLWIDDLTSSTLEKELSIFRWNRVTFGLSPSRVRYYCASLYESILRALKRWILP